MPYCLFPQYDVKKADLLSKKPLLLLLLLSLPLAADETLSEPDFAALLGKTPGEVMDILGPPEELYAHRGDEIWQDNVVFFYSRRLYLFWFGNRVWQIRLDREFGGTFLTCSMGDSREKVIRILGDPFSEDERSLIYKLPDRGYPVSLRLFFKDVGLDDLYLYRGDF